MMTTLFLSLILGCQQECPKCETVASACPAGMTCADSSAVDRYQLGTMNLPIGDGPTEIRKGPDLVGVGFRKNGVEDIVMFTTALDAGGSPCASPTLTVTPYPRELSPHHDPYVVGASSLTFKKLEYCDGGMLKECGAWDCFSNAAAFLHPATGVFKIIGDRIGQPASYVSNPAFSQRARGTIPAFIDFDHAECLSQTSFYEMGESHTDKAILPGDSSEVGWEFVGLWGQAGAPQEAVVVLRKPYDKVNALRHENMVLTDSNANQRIGDEWCQYVDSKCPVSSGAATCWMSVIGFTYK